MRSLKFILPIVLGIAVLAAWEFLVRHYNVPKFVLPAPSLIASGFTAAFLKLMAATWTTLRIVLFAFVLAVTSGVLLAVLFSQSRIVEFALYPYAVILLIGVIVAEFAAGTGTDTGLGWIIIESGNRLHTEIMFAALAILSALGIAIFFALTGLEWLLLHRWHESATPPAD
jgi:ABC-type nitrate/sulfonate/bicarbonate transport system permease component